MKGKFIANLKIRDYRLPSWCRWALCSAGLLCSVSWYFFTKVSWTVGPLKMGPTGDHKKLANKYQSTLCKNPDKQRPQAWKWRQHIPLKPWYLPTYQTTWCHRAQPYYSQSSECQLQPPRTITHKATNRTLELLTIVSSMGYVVLSGKIHVDKHETTFRTPVSKLVCSTLSLMWMFLRCKQKIQ